jgi:glycosyltransferase involved in cell wall biosynthesis
MRITATIVTLNEERNIARAIESLRCADEVVVVDSGSTDQTREIALRLGARVIEEPWRGYARQKNFAAEAAENEWILSIDADESITEELEIEILALKKDGVRFDGYSFPRLAQYLGRWIRHGGWYPDRKLRLYDRGRAEWVGDYVHESVRVKGTTGELDGDLLHYTCASLSEHLRTLDRYTSLAALEVRAQNKGVTMRRLALDPAWTFFRTYALRGGFLDGRQGLAIAWMAALYTFLKYAKAGLRKPSAETSAGAAGTSARATADDENSPSR